MSSMVSRSGSVGNAARAALRALWRGHRGLAALTAASAALLLASLVLQVADQRQVLGAPVWMKPAKFAASVGMAAPVVAWIIGQMAGVGRAGRVRAAGWVITAMATFELVLITFQAVRGVPSHFNASGPLDRIIFTAMGIGITVLWLAQLYIAWRAFRADFAQRAAGRARLWAIRFGLGISLLGGALGFVMTRPTSAQVESLRAGQVTPLVGAHAVGVPDGGPGLPLSRWSTEGGDLRVPHFFGLHALQGLPLLALFLERWERRGRRRRGPSSARVVVAAGVAWLGLTLTTLQQALRGQPLTAPDALTAVALVASLLAAAGVGYLTLNASEGGRSSWLRGNPVQ